MKIKVLILFFVILIPLNGFAMSQRYTQSPGIRFDSISKKTIKNVSCTWNGYNMAKMRLLPGQSVSQSFPLRNIKDFYGPVRLIWENERGQKFEKNFIFKENDLPISEIEEGQRRAKMKDYSRGAYVKFEFTQEGIEFYTSHTPGAAERGKRAGDIKYQIRKSIR